MTYQANIGASVRVGDVASHLEDLDTAIGLGERWEYKLAQAASLQELVERFRKQGPDSIEQAAGDAGFRMRDLAALDEWIHTGWQRPWIPGPWPYHAYRDPATLMQALADYQIRDYSIAPVQLRRMTYQNPLDVVIGGSGFLIGGAILVLRMIRDWGSDRRRASANADEAEAMAGEARAREDRAWTEADRERTVLDIIRWFEAEARAGRWHLPPSDLANFVSREDMAALNRLSAAEVTLELPQGLDLDRPESDV